MAVVRTGDDLPEACPRCRALLRRDFNFCPSCGERLREVCAHCRADLEPGWAYCAACGTARDARAGGPGAEAVVPLLEVEPLGDLEARAEAHNTRGSELYENDDFDEAIREFSAAVSLVPTNATYHTNLAVALSEIGEYERAVSEFHEAIRLDPGNAGTYLQLGYTYQEMERLQQAVEAWRQVEVLAPDSPEAEEAREAMDSI
jgi:tetratricopeptide (TPR) repeat protein